VPVVTLRYTGFALALTLTAFGAHAGSPPDSSPPLSGKSSPMPLPQGKPRLAFLDLNAGPEVTREVAQAAGELLVVALSETGKFDVITKADVKALLGYEAQAQLMGCGEASCMVDLGGALGAAYLVNGSLGRLGGQLQLTLALIDVNAATVGKRVSIGLNDSALQQGMRDAVLRLTGEVVGEMGPSDACGTPPCAREAIAACKHWWEKEWDALTIVGIVPDGPVDQLLVDGRPARIFRMIVRTRSRNGARDEYMAHVRFKKVDGDWYFDQASMGHLRGLPIAPDDPPGDAELNALLTHGFAAANGAGVKVVKLSVQRFADYTRDRPDRTPPEVANWAYTFGVTWSQAGKTTICPRAEAKLIHGKKGAWTYQHGGNGNCEEVLDAQ
jgi:TolB-like protein